MNVQTIFNLNGVANGSPLGLQQPTINFNGLPFGPWGALSTPANATGKLVGIANPSQYKVGVFAAESKTQFLSGTSMLATVAQDGSFSVPVPQSAADYVAVLMTPSYASDYYATNFPGGIGTAISSAPPLPENDPQNVLLSVEVPAGLNRTLRVGQSLYNEMFLVSPGTSWNTGTGISRSLQPNSNPNYHPPNPTDPTQFPQLWQMLQQGSSLALSYFIGAQSSTGQQTKGALVLSLYVYQNAMYLIAGYGPVGQSSIQPNFVSTAIVNWQAFPPSMVQVGCTITILSDDIMLSVDVVNVEPSVMSVFLQAYEHIVKDMFKVLFAML